MTDSVIGFNDINNQIDLGIGVFKIDIVGGWKIELNDFYLTLENLKSKEIITPNKIPFWRIQSYIRGKRAKRVFTFQNTKHATYKVNFYNVDSLKVKKSNLIISSLFSSYLSNKDLSLHIYR